MNYLKYSIQISDLKYMTDEDIIQLSEDINLDNIRATIIDRYNNYIESLDAEQLREEAVSLLAEEYISYETYEGEKGDIRRLFNTLPDNLIKLILFRTN